MAKTPAWQRKEGKSKSGGLNRKGIASYRRANPGSKLKMQLQKRIQKENVLLDVSRFVLE